MYYNKSVKEWNSQEEKLLENFKDFNFVKNGLTELLLMKQKHNMRFNHQFQNHQFP